MKKFILMLVIFAFGYQTATYTRPFRTVEVHHGLVFEVHAYGLGVKESVEAWKAEIPRRFPDAFVFVCHGFEDIDGIWMTYPQDELESEPVQELADRLRAEHPFQTIILVMCNPGADKIDTPGVYYALDSVWFFPDRSINEAKDRADMYPNEVGSIFEFVTGMGPHHK